MKKGFSRRITNVVAVTVSILAGTAAIAACALALILVGAPEKTDNEQSLSFAAFEEADHALSLEQALARLSTPDAKRVAELATNRSEAPFWLLTTAVPAQPQAVNSLLIVMPSRHVQVIRYWFLAPDNSIVRYGQTTRASVTGREIFRDRAGFAIVVPHSSTPLRLVARIEASGPARITAYATDQNSAQVAQQYFDRSGGVLFGSLLMIAAFSALVSLFSREATFFLYAAWVIASLRLASFSAGWDLGWLGYENLERYPTLARNLPLAAYAVFTVALFWGIFRREIGKIRAVAYIRVLLYLSFGLVAISTITPHRNFLPILWAVVFPSIITLIFLGTRIFLRTGSRAAAWYGASWLAALIGLLGDVAYASGLTSYKPTLLSSLSSAVLAALLAGVALALRLKSERLGRLTAQREKFEVLRKFKQNYDSMPVGLFSMNRLGAVTLFNPAFSAMFHLGEAQFSADRSIPMGSLLGADAVKRFEEAFNSREPLDIEIDMPGDDEKRRWFQSRVTGTGDAVEGTIQDVTARKEAESKLRYLVDHDSLTGMLNRHGLEDAMRSAAEAARCGLPCAIAHVDLDRFKLINDLYGHATGDAMIQEASKRLLSTVRSRDFVARIADSFVILLLDCPDRAVARLTERLRQEIGERPFELDGRKLTMTVSVGVTELDPEVPPVEAMAAADRACAEAKARGRNCVVRMSDDDDTLRRHMEELRVVADIQHRLPTDRYFLEMQPIVSLRSARASLNYEVLLRMSDPHGGVIPPGKFIGAAERNGLMSQIDRWVVKTTLEWLDAHSEHRDRLTFATINISGSSLNDARFIDDVVSMIREHPLSVNKMCFEITESIALHDLESTRRFVDRLRSYGSKLALDDFGAGYTSFNYLKEIPADFIKIDGSFVKDINANPANYAITRTIVDLTHELGMRSIAEWAETPDTVASLIDLRVDYAQGYGLARPLNKDLLAAAQSSGALVRDPQVLTLLDNSAAHPIAAKAAGARRH